jgi:hypothetical protein
MAAMYLTCLRSVFVAPGTIARATGFSPLSS